MNRNAISTVAIAAALTLAACAKKAPEELPPPPPPVPTSPTDTGPVDSGQVGTGVVPGSRADLWSVDLTGVNERRIPTPLDGSDPAWSPLLR